MIDATRLLDPRLGVVRQEAITLGMSGAQVFRMLTADGDPVAIVKVVHSRPEELAGEIERLIWLSNLGIRVPEVLGVGEFWFAMRVLPGRPASDPWPAQQRSAVIDQLADAARELHSTPVEDAPFDSSISGVMKDVRGRVAAEALTELEGAFASLGNGQLRLSHGDLSLPNVILTPTGTAGFVDGGRAGLADPHSDVADLLRSLRSDLNPQFGPADAERFMDAYGRSEIDPERLRLHDLLNSFF